MNDKRVPRGLGRGLSSLLADIAPSGAEGAPAAPLTVAITQIHPNPGQPRRSYDPEKLEELAQSLRSHGVIQPLIVRRHPEIEGAFEIVAGERRWRAAQKAQLHELPILVREFTDSELMEVALIENIQRADLNPVEEARAFRELIERHGHTQEKVAEALSISRSRLANTLRLLNLPEPVLALLESGQLTAGQARPLITADRPVELAQEIVRRGLSAREAEKLAKSPAKTPQSGGSRSSEKDADTRALESDLSAALKMSVRITHEGHDGGTVSIRYRSLEQLDDLCRRLGGEF